MLPGEGLVHHGDPRVGGVVARCERAPFEDVGGDNSAGLVNVLYGSIGGLTATGDETAAGDERVGYELLERVDDGTLRAWVSADPMSLEEFEAIETVA